ncbi:unnamed protein product [Ostreobium quekettii]|uniref:EGF-like domain-containing protein n=1 Tax=Ostreobium quekettii TaxID=121088 RepID=A0A8S1JFR9_9CHLO|nr:unnamed protein product [Ostreobium quekettii]
MGSSVLRLGCLWLLAASLLCVADCQEDGLKGARKVLHVGDELGCPCAHEGHFAGDCPCHLDTTWLDNDECPSCPVYACGECDPLKCDECKRCCDGAVPSDDRKTCSCPSCDITGCLECDAEDCSKCLVCQHGFKLGVDRKCECNTCHVPYCETCEPDNCYKCKTCNPFLALASDGRACECPECPINGCKVCNPEKCDECIDCINGDVISYGGCKVDEVCHLPNCVVCPDGTTCEKCAYGYEPIDYGAKCKCAECAVDNCAECSPENCDECLKCKDGFDLTFPPTGYEPGEVPALPTCEVHDCEANVPHCAICDEYDPTVCKMCKVGFKWCDKDKVCKCEHCAVPGCQTCDNDDCGVCKVCADGYVLADDGVTCVCATCDVPYCDTCSVYDCSVCGTVCIDGYAPGPSGECECASCQVPHCERCDPSDCTKCEKCTHGYGPSGGTDCPCEMCDVTNCKTCDPEDCEKCAVCNDGYILNDPGYGEPTCDCDPAACTVDNCDTCGPADCQVCSICVEGLTLDSYGNCECECGIPGCQKCCTSDCGTCSVCEPGLVLSDDKKSCVCPECKVDDCEACSPSDCSVCGICAHGKVVDAYGCACPPCGIDKCVTCDPYECGTCKECEVNHVVSYDGKSCDCACDHIAGCTACDENCKCVQCDKGLILSKCGYCLEEERSCDWVPIESDGKSCDKVCAEHSAEHPLAVSSGFQGKYGNAYPCFADLDDAGYRPGNNWDKTHPELCVVEYGTTGYDSSQVHTANSTSFYCICQTVDGPLDSGWIRRQHKKELGAEEHCELGDECAGNGNCRDICHLIEKEPVAWAGPGEGYGGDSTIEYTVCKTAMRAGYNIENEPYKGYCMNYDKGYNKEYECLCANPCTTKAKEEDPDCGYGDGGYGASEVHMAVV